MTIIFVVNKVIGRDYIGAVDAGAYFGLTVARALYNPAHAKVSCGYSGQILMVQLSPEK